MESKPLAWDRLTHSSKQAAPVSIIANNLINPGLIVHLQYLIAAANISRFIVTLNRVLIKGLDCAKCKKNPEQKQKNYTSWFQNHW